MADPGADATTAQALIAKWRERARVYEAGRSHTLAAVANWCADELEAALAAVPPQGLEDERLIARRVHQSKIAEVAYRLFKRLGKDDQDAMELWSLAIIDPEPPTEAEIQWARSKSSVAPVVASGPTEP